LSENEQCVVILIADGLGHGPSAAEAAEAVARAFEANPFAGPKAILQSGHSEATGSRGAAAAVAQLSYDSGVLRYAGVGNIAGNLILDGQSRGLASHNGIVGVQIRKVQEFEYTRPASGLLIMHSDGVQTRWSLDHYPGLARRHPAVISAVLARDFKRGRDDLTVVVVRFPGER
jgi:hypothetical protein